MANNIQDLKTDPSVLSALEQAAARKATPQEIFEQRVSFVFSSLSESSGATREHVKQVIREQQEGVASEQ